MTTRKYSSRSQQTTLTANITSTATTATVLSASALLGGLTIAAGETYTVVIDPDTALEEIVDIYSASGNPVTTNTLTIVRGVEAAGVGQAHSAGAVVRHMAIGRDFREANTHIESTLAHGVTGAVVGTGNTQTLTNKTLTSPTITGTGAIAGTFTGNLTGNVTGNVSGTSGSTTGNAATVTNGVYTTDTGTVTSTMIANGTIVNADVNTSAQIAYSKINATNSIVDADINASAAIALSKLATNPVARANHTGTQTASTISDFDTQVRTSRLDQMAAPTDSVSVNSQKITNLATPTSTTDAATKAYADLMVPLSSVGVANGVAELDADGLVPVHHLPPLSITTTQVVSSQAAMLALTAQIGDVAVRTDVNKTFILTASPATTLGNWQELLTPTDSVLSVDGQTGAVSLSSTYATVANAANKLPLAGGTMSGAIAMGTNKITGLGDPTNAQDAVTKYYLDNVVLAPSNLTGPITSTGAATAIASQTGTGTKFVMDTSPTLVTPNIGVATATSINGTSIPSSKTLVATDSTTYVVPTQTGNSGKYLTTDGTTSSWGSTVVPADYSAKGVVLVGTGAGTYSSQTVGTDGQVLTANSAQADGVEWTTPTAGVSTSGGSTITVASGTTVPLTIQNNGTGNSFVVNDAASDTTPFTIAADGKVSIGNTTAVPGLTLTPEHLLISTDTASGAQLTIRKSFDGSNNPNMFFAKSRGTNSSQTAVQLNDNISNIVSFAFDGTNYVQSVAITSSIDGTVSTGVAPGRLTFSTTNAAGAPLERMRINSSGGVEIGGKDIELMTIMGAF